MVNTDLLPSTPSSWVWIRRELQRYTFGNIKGREYMYFSKNSFFFAKVVNKVGAGALPTNFLHLINRILNRSSNGREISSSIFYSSEKSRDLEMHQTVKAKEEILPGHLGATD